MCFETLPSVALSKASAISAETFTADRASREMYCCEQPTFSANFCWLPVMLIAFSICFLIFVIQGN